jgi:hypothetical protein
MPPTTGDIFLECVRKPGLLSDLDTFPPNATTDILKQILGHHMSVLPSDAVVTNLYGELQNIGMRVWLHDLLTWVITHPAPSSPHRMPTLGGGGSWQPTP